MAAVCAMGMLAACSSLPNAINPIAWYRDLTGASKDDSLDKNAPNQQNLEAGGKEPYPNLASVPAAPTDATSTFDRDALQKSLIADRANAQYNDEQLRAGLPSPAAAPEAADELPSAAPAATANAAAQQQASNVPAETPLVSPSIPSVPQGESPPPPPPPPRVPATPVATQALAAPPPGRPLASVGAAMPVASIAFAQGSMTLTGNDLARLSQIAAMQQKQGGALRIVGHAAEANDNAQQKLADFTLALNRAKEVAKALSGDGVPQQAIAVEAAPAASGDMLAGATEIFLQR